MTAALDLPADRSAHVLDIGTGSGYQAAVLATVAARVASVEIVAPLARMAAARLRRMGYATVTVRAGDGFLGWPEQAPFDGIVVAASATAVPQPLVDQLKVGAASSCRSPVRHEHAIAAHDQARRRSLDRCTLGPRRCSSPSHGGRVPRSRPARWPTGRSRCASRADRGGA